MTYKKEKLRVTKKDFVFRLSIIKQLLMTLLTALLIIPNSYAHNDEKKVMTLRVATFNVSMEALNYQPKINGKATKISNNELSHLLTKALTSEHQQIKNIAEIIQRINPDIILLNEFDRMDNNLPLFLQNYLSKSQNGQKAIDYPYHYQGSVNTGVLASTDLNNNGKIDTAPADTYGFGYFPGHFGMVLLSKYPLDIDNIRTFQYFKWHDMPKALQPIDPKTNKPWYNEKAWQDFRLSSKSHWDIPVNVNGNTIHILASHPTPPVFDGPEDRNGKRNHDEIRFWADYIDKEKSSYIYDDKNITGGLAENSAFIILGDQNASSVDGDAINNGIITLLENKKIQDAKPTSKGGKQHSPDNKNAENHTAYWRMRADYVLPSKKLFTIKDSGVFWPLKSQDTFRLIKNRQASSDHRLVWLDLEITTK